MVPEDLLFWLAPLLGTESEGLGNVLCRRHADAMVVPRGWTLDDRREPVPRLFMPATSPTVDRPGPTPRRRARTEPAGEQLQIDGTGEIDRPVVDDLSPDAPAETPVETPVESAADIPATAPWTPVFDHDDDLDGLLAVRSPLLSRAFRGSPRPDRGSGR